MTGFFYNKKSFEVLCEEMYSEKNEENSFINIPSSLPVSLFYLVQGACFIVEANTVLFQK